MDMFLFLICNNFPIYKYHLLLISVGILVYPHFYFLLWCSKPKFCTLFSYFYSWFINFFSCLICYAKLALWIKSVKYQNTVKLFKLKCLQNPNEDTEWNDILRQKGIIPQKEKEITEDEIVSMLEETIENKTGMLFSVWLVFMYSCNCVRYWRCRE